MASRPRRGYLAASKHRGSWGQETAELPFFVPWPEAGGSVESLGGAAHGLPAALQRHATLWVDKRAQALGLGFSKPSTQIRKNELTAFLPTICSVPVWLLGKRLQVQASVQSKCRTPRPCATTEFWNPKRSTTCGHFQLNRERRGNWAECVARHA